MRLRNIKLEKNMNFFERIETLIVLSCSVICIDEDDDEK